MNAMKEIGKTIDMTLCALGATLIPLSRAFWCENCEAVIATATSCPGCAGTTSIIPLSKWIAPKLESTVVVTDPDQIAKATKGTLPELDLGYKFFQAIGRGNREPAVYQQYIGRATRDTHTLDSKEIFDLTMISTAGWRGLVDEVSAEMFFRSLQSFLKLTHGDRVKILDSMNLGIVHNPMDTDFQRMKSSLNHIMLGKLPHRFIDAVTEAGH